MKNKIVKIISNIVMIITTCLFLSPLGICLVPDHYLIEYFFTAEQTDEIKTIQNEVNILKSEKIQQAGPYHQMYIECKELELASSKWNIIKNIILHTLLIGWLCVIIIVIIVGTILSMTDWSIIYGL